MVEPSLVPRSTFVEKMSLDPSRWFVSFAGFVYDWILTREWVRILACLIPTLLVIGTITAVWWGRTIDKRELASWYMELGEEEISDWQEKWTKGDQTEAAESSATSDSEETADEGDELVKAEEGISNYADILFRRVQQLVPSDRSEFYIAARLAQRGATEQAVKKLEKIAPLSGKGFPDAHAFLALLKMQQLNQENYKQVSEELRHHITVGSSGENAPQNLLKAGSDLMWMFGQNQFQPDKKRSDFNLSLQLLSRAAESEPQLKLNLAKRASLLSNDYVLQKAAPDAQKHYEEQVKESPKDDTARVALAESHFIQGDLDAAEKIVREGLAIERTDKLKRALSEIYRKRFRNSLSREKGVVVSNIKLLNIALEADPSNPSIADEIALLLRLNSSDANEELVSKLKEIVASGLATGIARKWLAEAFLLRKDYENALPQLEQVVTRLPDDVKSQNNLAYVLGAIRPDRLDEAIEHSKLAILKANAMGEPNADFFDTLGTIYAKKEEYRDAVTALEKAIELAPDRKDFRERIIFVFNKLGDKDMVAIHEKIIQRLVQREIEMEKAKKEAPAEQAAPESDVKAEPEKAAS